MYSNTKNATAQSLLRHDKTVLLGCHIFYGMDFCAPYGIEYIKGRYTVNKVLKIAEKGGFTGGGRHNGILFILTRNAPEKSFSQVFILGRDWFYFPDDLITPLLMRAGRFSFKKDFEACRKSDTAETYILWQNKEFLKKSDTSDPSDPDYNKIDPSARYKILKVHTFHKYNSPDVEYVDHMLVERIGGNGRLKDKKSYCPYDEIHGWDRSPKRINDIIDKSGYFVQDRRENLRIRAMHLRYNKKEQHKEN